MKISQAKDIPKGCKIKAIERGQRLKSSKKRIVTNMVDVQYVVSDQGINLCKAYAQAGLTHIPDCSHVLALNLDLLKIALDSNTLEKLTKADPKRTSFFQLKAQCLGKNGT